jgi:hypothetical protein
MGSTAASMALLVGATYLKNRSQARASNKYAQAQAVAQIASINRAREMDKRRKERERKRLTATQRAQFGASGTGGRGGSADSVLWGLEKPYAESIEDSRLRANSKIGHIQSSLQHTKKSNLLDASRPVRRYAYSMFQKSIPGIISLLD